MDKIFEKTFRRKLTDYFSSLKKNKDSAINEFFDIVRKEDFSLYAFGGFPRDIYLNGKKANPRDIDLVIYNFQMELFKSRFENFIIGENKFNGLKLNYKGIIIDIWPLEQTWAFTENHVNKTSFFQDLQKTTFLNFESLLFEVNPFDKKNRKVFYNGFNNIFNSKTLELNLKENPFPDLNIIRALYIAKKYNFKVGPKLALFILENYKKFDLEYLCSIYEKKYNMSFSKNELETALQILSSHFEKSSEPHQVLLSSGKQQVLGF